MITDTHSHKNILLKIRIFDNCINYFVQILKKYHLRYEIRLKKTYRNNKIFYIVQLYGVLLAKTTCTLISQFMTYTVVKLLLIKC